MPNINDTYASVLSGYSGSVNDRRSELLTGILAYATPLSLNDMEAAALASLGYTGALNDAWDKYIKALGGFGTSEKADYLSSTFYGNPVPFLFASSQPGAWYDPSDLTTLFTDSAGTTPVTAAGQTVGLMLDKSQGLVLGSELRGSGAIGLVGTATAATYNTTTGVGTVTRVDASNQSFVQWTGLTSVYTKITISCTSGVAITVRAGTYTGTGIVVVSGQTITLYSLASGGAITITSSSATSGFTVTSIKASLGNHATQATSTQRPIYGINPITGTRNLMKYSQQFDNAVWQKLGTPTVTADTAVAPDGTTTVDRIVIPTGAAQGLRQDVALVAGTYRYSVWARAIGATTTLRLASFALDTTKVTIFSVPTGDLVRYSTTFTYAVGGTAQLRIDTQDFGGTLELWGAQIELGSTATAYQKVVSQYEVTEAGVASTSYLAFDGVDDGMVTNTITPAIDKVQVFAGVRKLSDAAQKIVAEMSATIASNAGVFALTAPNSAAANYNFSSKGTTQTDNVVTTYTAPITNVISGLGDISGASNLIRVNGSQVGSTLTTQGTGNYLAYPLYIGRRGGTTLPFNGRLYSLIVRFGANLTTGQITSTEKWVNGKTGAF